MEDDEAGAYSVQLPSGWLIVSLPVFKGSTWVAWTKALAPRIARAMTTIFTGFE